MEKRVKIIRVVRAPDAPSIANLISRQNVARDGAEALRTAGIVDDVRVRIAYTEGVGVIGLSVLRGNVRRVKGLLKEFHLAVERVSSDSSVLAEGAMPVAPQDEPVDASQLDV